MLPLKHSIGFLLLAVLLITAATKAEKLAEEIPSSLMEPPPEPNWHWMSCKFCEINVLAIKSYAHYDEIKERLAQVCVLLGDKSKIRQCKDMVRKMTADFDKMRPLDFCRKIHICY